jgi:hypothetical protein
MMPSPYLVGSIVVGSIKIVQYSNGKIWIVKDNGIGIEVDSHLLEDELKKFYDTNK